MKLQKLSFYLTSASLLLVVLFGYQNCSQTHFSSDLDGAMLKAETVSDGHVAGDDGQANPGDGVVAPTPTPMPDGSTPDDKKPPQAGGKDKDKTPDSSTDTSDLVECQMLHPNKKIVLSYDLFVQPGNSSSVRVCMSTNACLKLINAFAVQHSCSLDASAPMAQADLNSQCTEIFPGSKGTCHNASIVTDEQVSELIKKLSN